MNKFKEKNFEDFEILNDSEKVGDIRVKPSGVLWSPRGSHKWFRVNLKTFADFMEKNGTEQDK
jgi:hypothetical protein